MQLIAAVAWCAVIVAVGADINLSNPRGSNNRLNEKTATRSTGNRLFDSQNNARGGYNTGDRNDKAAKTASEQYQMKYFQSGSSVDAKSLLMIEWTNQHGCGGDEDTDPHKTNCNLVLQYMCEEEESNPLGDEFSMRDGLNTNRPKYSKPGSLSESTSQWTARRNGDADANRGMQEPWDFYDRCYVRERNQGLFFADQKQNGKNKFGYASAIFTRQNNDGDRNGYECVEERDYYPYWHPSPWKDMVILAENETLCSYYHSRSHNTVAYGECIETSSGVQKSFSRWNNAVDCADNGGTWLDFDNYLEKAPQFTDEPACVAAQTANTDSRFTYFWGRPRHPTTQNKECLVSLKSPDCKPAPWTRSNHLGNSKDGEASRYEWTIPHFPSGKSQRCSFRIRYNISTDDFDPYNTDSTFNGKTLISGNPHVLVGADSPLRLAINTAQFGRTFQDRSHIFTLEPRPTDLQSGVIYNLNVRGKRGNIVQVFPAVMYDFVPNDLHIKASDMIHIQWTGSNSHDNNSPAGDGQSGDDGTGEGGTDRSNFVEILDLGDNYPVPYGHADSKLWKNAHVIWASNSMADKDPYPEKELALNLASGGYYDCFADATCPVSVETKTQMSPVMDNADASYEGLVLRLNAGTYHYMCTRNNNFANRSQKGTIVVVADQ